MRNFGVLVLKQSFYLKAAPVLLIVLCASTLKVFLIQRKLLSPDKTLLSSTVSTSHTINRSAAA